jgi:hypothetical protein
MILLLKGDTKNKVLTRLKEFLHFIEKPFFIFARIWGEVS